ncbi:holo-ACP synthase [Corynebacterium felinum]|uniref:Holo-[acyl-carrier-protein] synthase n=1 Tax=Corynebacterium felinum TaxID=131318 RepID=A0ABU2B4W1_9CORY|nr:holo-ACP synthase [Corynebacterium felinum]MDF5820582.1 holo-ACP synthase [Corynebacterium felinum]MDR7353649.1 holo-[acyl-carrier protein] synthase [Corynebacterium felinum]WJY95828.1 Holo-[acyl-carrier-protein] synthase [Corynebacterium felinum]
MSTHPGIDLVHIPSFAELLNTPGSRFDQVFSAREHRIATTKPRRDEHLAGRWAAKEAFIKAWSQSRYGQPPSITQEQLNWREIEIIPDAYNRPIIHLSGTIADITGIDTIPVSISHDGDYATAICIFNT